MKIPSAKDRALHYTPVYLVIYVAVDNVANCVVHEFFRNSVVQQHNKSLAPSLRLYPDPYVSSPDPNNQSLRTILLLRNTGLDISVVSSLQVFPYICFLPRVLHCQPIISFIWSRYKCSVDSRIKRDQLDVTCFFITLFNVQHVSDVNTSILRSLRLIC